PWRAAIPRGLPTRARRRPTGRASSGGDGALQCSRRKASMKGPVPAVHIESRWPPALVIIVGFVFLAALRCHIRVLPGWGSYLAGVAIVASMTGVALSRGHAVWGRIEGAIVVLVAVLYVVNTIAELADMIGVITLHPTARNPFSLLSSSVAIWIVNILM